MNIFPAIDLLDGQAVRLFQGDYEQKTGYGDPLEIAHRYAEAGAKYLHLVDLGAAKKGQTADSTLATIKRILTETELKVEVGGGIRSEEDIKRWRELGVWRCVIGTRAAEDPEFARIAYEHYGDAVIVGIDARGEMVATHGWTQNSEKGLIEFAKQLYSYGYRECIYTDIEKDGTLQGASVLKSVRLAEESGLRVVVSGGVKDLDDITAMPKYEKQGISGVIIGKALFTGKLDLRAALLAANGGHKTC